MSKNPENLSYHSPFGADSGPTAPVDVKERRRLNNECLLRINNVMRENLFPEVSSRNILVAQTETVDPTAERVLNEVGGKISFIVATSTGRLTPGNIEVSSRRSIICDDEYLIMNFERVAGAGKVSFDFPQMTKDGNFLLYARSSGENFYFGERQGKETVPVVFEEDGRIFCLTVTLPKGGLDALRQEKRNIKETKKWLFLEEEDDDDKGEIIWRSRATPSNVQPRKSDYNPLDMSKMVIPNLPPIKGVVEQLVVVKGHIDKRGKWVSGDLDNQATGSKDISAGAKRPKNEQGKNGKHNGSKGKVETKANRRAGSGKEKGDEKRHARR